MASNSIVNGPLKSDDCRSHSSGRFRVVRLPSIGEPYSRGRWTCCDTYEQRKPFRPITVQPSREERRHSLVLENPEEFVSASINAATASLAAGGDVVGGQGDSALEAEKVEEEIGNTIHTAMELVKSHLTQAVREEVDVLKDQICSLQRLNQALQAENQYLRRFVSPETLANFQQQSQTDSSSGQNNHHR